MTRKILIALTILFLQSCASSKRVYVVKNIENRADEIIKKADWLRLNKKYKESLNEYIAGSALYLRKWEKKKYMITQLKMAIIYLKLNNMERYNQIIKNVEDINEKENLGYKSEILGVKVRYLYKEGRFRDANTLIDEILKLTKEKNEKNIYYTFLKSKFNKDAISDTKLKNLRKILKILKSEYVDGELLNIEGLLYSSLSMSEILYRNKYYLKAIEELKFGEGLIRTLELTNLYERIFNSYINCYKELKNDKYVSYYINLLREFKKVH